MKRSALGTFVAINTIALSGCSTFAGEVITKFDQAGHVIEKSCKGFHASLGESSSECLETEGISQEGAVALEKVLDAAAVAVRMVTPPILSGGSGE